jgi:hypothetical protein
MPQGLATLDHWQRLTSAVNKPATIDMKTLEYFSGMNKVCWSLTNGITFHARDLRWRSSMHSHVSAERGVQRKPPLQRPLRAEYFTDREQEQRWLLDLLASGKIVTLCGPGGMGKTALIAEVLWKLFQNETPSDTFRDGLIFHSFYRQPEAAIALEQIARLFGEEPLPTPAPWSSLFSSVRNAPQEQ